MGAARVTPVKQMLRACKRKTRMEKGAHRGGRAELREAVSGGGDVNVVKVVPQVSQDEQHRAPVAGLKIDDVNSSCRVGLLDKGRAMALVTRTPQGKCCLRLVEVILPSSNLQRRGFFLGFCSRWHLGHHAIGDVAIEALVDHIDGEADAALLQQLIEVARHRACGLEGAIRTVIQLQRWRTLISYKTQQPCREKHQFKLGDVRMKHLPDEPMLRLGYEHHIFEGNT